MKSSKISVMDTVELTVLFLALAVAVLFEITKRELLLFGYLFNEFFISSIIFVISVIVTICNVICKMKRKNLYKEQKVFLAVFCAMAVICTAMNTYMCCDDIKNTIDTEQITFSDGNKILLRERIGYVKSILVKYEATYTYMDVYQIKGITAKKLGETGEQYFTNRSLLQDIYTYEYDETSKKLTLHHKKEYDTEIWEKEFLLE